ncbi:GIY-YIG nuclease family protein [Azotobacter salinestris]|uniref:GIY-YIG nuclease family protein n=1 Tax=Azotobacter salinestris TaxID=69964 RepID=UPI0032DE433B
MPKKKTKEQIIKEFRAIHGDRYDYSPLEYQGTQFKVKIICPKHGIYTTLPEHHLKGTGCRKCYFESQKTSKAEFIKRAKAYFKDRYDYSAIGELPASGKKVLIRCKEHEAWFNQDWRSHSRGHSGCQKCKSLKLSGPLNSRGHISSEAELTEAFITRAREAHGNTYDYSKFTYTTSHQPGKIICPSHGEFWQTPSNHLRGTKCPQCSKTITHKESLKEKCKLLGINYWRALKRREAGLSEDKILNRHPVRNLREVNPITVFGQTYPNLEEAARQLKPPASTITISRWIDKGMTPSEAFATKPNLGGTNGVVYLVTHKQTGKQYVGITIQSIERRWKGHIDNSARSDIKSEQSLHAAIRKFGPESFTIEIIDHGSMNKDLEAKERAWIKKLNTLTPNGFNISTGGSSGGSTPKPVTVDGLMFKSRRLAAKHISETRKITIYAAEYRLRKNRIDIKKPVKSGKYKIHKSIQR